MKRLPFLFLALSAASLLLAAARCTSPQPEQAGRSADREKVKTGSPSDQLPPWITRMSYFGQRADLSLDG